jgi:DNA invertase Pin-like site-specific DNA recombinase
MLSQLNAFGVLHHSYYNIRDPIATASVLVMKIGYARTSTVEQAAGFEAQLAELTALGCEKIFREQVSSVAERPQLTATLDYLRDGDVLIVTKLDRLARSVPHLLEVVDRVRAKGASAEVLNLGKLDDTATGKLMLTMLGAIAAFEREMMLERQREGIAAAKAAGKYKGRKPTARAKAAEVCRLAADGVAKAEIARRLGIHRASVHRILAA